MGNVKFDRSILVSGAASFGLKAGGMVLGLATSIILARSLGVAGFGEYSFIFALVTLVALPSQIGLPVLIVRETALAHQENKTGRILAIWRWAGKVVVTTSFVCAALLLLVFWIASPTNYSLKSLLWSLPLLPLIAIGNVRGAALRGLGNVIIGQLPEVLLRPLFFLLCLGVFVLFANQTVPMSPARALQIQALGSAVAFGIGLYFLWHLSPKEKLSNVPTLAATERNSFLVSSAVLGLAAGLQMLNAVTDLLMLGILSTPETVGIYKAAVNISGVLAFGSLSLIAVIMPRIARLYSEKSTVKLQSLLQQSARMMLLFTCSGALVLFTAGELIFQMLYGDGFANAAFYAKILSIGHVIIAFFGPLAATLNMTGFEKLTIRCSGAGFAVNVLLNLLLIPQYGATGAALATLCSTITWNILMFAALKKTTSLRSTAL